MIFEVSEESFKVEINGKSVEIHTRKSNRARHVSIKINVKGEVVLVIPKRSSFTRAKSFLLTKLPWIRKHLASVEKSRRVENATIPIFDRHYSIKHIVTEGRSMVKQNDDVIEITGHTDDVYFSLVQYLKRLLLKVVSELVQENSVRHNLRYSAIRLGRGVSTWGSCSKDNKLSFNWRLVFAPYNVVQYLVAHEMAHIKERNHGPRFWRLVKIIYPESDIARKWLKKEGRSLYKTLEEHR